MEGERLRALVTGASGFLGSHVVEQLLELGYEVRLRDFAVSMARALGRPEPKVFIPFGGLRRCPS
jgi:nucleoside-diphosphate-sugar epimerase